MNLSNLRELIDHLNAQRLDWSVTLQGSNGETTGVDATWEKPCPSGKMGLLPIDRRPEQVAADYEQMRERRG